jgi:hypothetical protein
MDTFNGNNFLPSKNELNIYFQVAECEVDVDV